MAQGAQGRAPGAGEQRLQTVCLLLLTTLAVATALHWLSKVLIPFVLALLVTIAVRPVVSWLTRRGRIPRPLAIAMVFLLGLGVFSVAGGLVSTSVSQLAANADVYQQTLTGLAESGLALIPFERFGIGPESIAKQLASLPIGSLLVGLANALIEILSNAVLVLIFVVFLLIGGERASSTQSPVWRQIEARIERYLVTKVALSAATGVVVGLLLFALGVDLAFLFGFLAFLFNFIPSVGSIIATLLPLPIILMSPESSWTTAVLALALPGSVQLLIGNVIEPKVMGESLGLHPIVILIALIFWGVLWGIVGMLLATPMTAVLKILLERYEITRPAARLMAGEF